MRYIFCLLNLMMTCVFLACGSSEKVQMRVVTSTGASGVKQQLSNQYNQSTGAYRGLYVVVYEMNDCPNNIDDVPSLDTPVAGTSTTARGLDPMEENISVDTSGLEKGKFYRVDLNFVDASNVTTHQAIAECPVYLDNTTINSPIRLCFGPTGVSMSACPGLKQEYSGNCIYPSRC